MNPLPESVGVGSNLVFGFDGNVSGVGLTLEMTGSNSDDMIKRQFSLGFQGGFDGMSPNREIALGSSISTGNSQGFDLTDSTKFGSKAYAKSCERNFKR